MTPTDLPKGFAVGSYHVIRLLGRGGMGEVYEVEHREIRKRYALKFLNQDLLSNPECLERLRREAEVMANLSHPNILQVDDFGEDNGRYWLRMELVLNHGGHGDTEVGASLASYLRSRDGRIQEAEVRETLRQILNGLAYAHGKGVVHRDLKPANILLAPRREQEVEAEKWRVKGGETSGACWFTAKIADFGLVRLVGEEWLRSQAQTSVSLSLGAGTTRIDSHASEGSTTQALIGTYAYMSPEQKRGEPADERSDLYAVGLMAFQMLTGERSIDLMRPSQMVPGLTKEWDDWLEHAIHPRQDRRFSSARQMADRLPGRDNVRKTLQVASKSTSKATPPSPKQVSGVLLDGLELQWKTVAGIVIRGVAVPPFEIASLPVTTEEIEAFRRSVWYQSCPPGQTEQDTWREIWTSLGPEAWEKYLPVTVFSASSLSSQTRTAATGVPWIEAIAFCNYLTHLEGSNAFVFTKQGTYSPTARYRLPNSLELEAAVRNQSIETFSTASWEWTMDHFHQNEGRAINLSKRGAYGIADLSGRARTVFNSGGSVMARTAKQEYSQIGSDIIFRLIRNPSQNAD